MMKLKAPRDSGTGESDTCVALDRNVGAKANSGRI